MFLKADKVDGDSHDYGFNEDSVRQRRLEALGVRFLRFSDREVKGEMDNALRTIEAWVLGNR